MNCENNEMAAKEYFKKKLFGYSKIFLISNSTGNRKTWA